MNSIAQLQLEPDPQSDGDALHMPVTGNPLRPPFELAKASPAIPGAIKPCEHEQSFVDVGQLSPWADKKASNRPSVSLPDPSLPDGVYARLVGDHDIRVLEIRPGSANDPICGTLHHCSLEFDTTAVKVLGGFTERSPVQYATSLTDPTKPIWYTALSYRWGDPADSVAIEIQGKPLDITKSLHEILQHLRQPDRSVIMWIDQICINQGDNEEKGGQIGLMSKIYRRALNTAIWLAASPLPDTINQLDMLEECAAKLQFLDESRGSIPLEELVTMALPAPDSESWEQLWYVLSQPYFQRLWIIQEVILSYNPWVILGRHIASWSVLADACRGLATSGLARWLDQRFSSARDQVDDTCYIVNNLAFLDGDGTGLVRLMQILEDTRHAMCFDQRDKIYGVLGLEYIRPGDSTEWRITANYAKEYTAGHLYRDVAVCFLERNAPSMKLVSLLVNVDHDQSLDELPSWAPDWSKPRQTTSIGASLGHSLVYTASKAPQGGPGIDPDDYAFGNDKRELHVRGRLFDAVALTTGALKDPDLSWQNPAESNKALRRCYKIAEGSSAYPAAGVTVFEAFWRTLVADKDAPPDLDKGNLARERAPAAAFEDVLSLVLDATTTNSPSLPGQTYSQRQTRPPGRGRLTLESLAQPRSAARDYQRLRAALRLALANRAFGATAKGYFGLFPGHVAPGDVVAVLRGCHVPFVLRPVAGEAGRFRLVGECYVHGIMHGEAMESGEDRTFVLV